MIVELFTENATGGSNESNEEPREFPMVPLIQEELVRFAKKKLLESIELQQFIGEKEIDFLRKYISFLDVSNANFNNQNDLENQFALLELDPSQRSEALESARRRLAGLEKQKSSLGNREQKALESFVAPLQIRIFSNESVSATECSLFWSLSLRKIHCILEKIGCLEWAHETRQVVAHFWFTEILGLLEKLEENEKHLLMEKIVAHTESSQVFIHLLVFLFEKQEQMTVRFFEKEHSMENSMKHFDALASMFLETNSTSASYEKVLKEFAALSIRILNRREIQTGHLELILRKYEVFVARDDYSVFRGNFDDFFTMLEAKTGSLGGDVLQSRASQLRRPMVGDVPFVPVISSETSSSSPFSSSTTTTNPANNIPLTTTTTACNLSPSVTTPPANTSLNRATSAGITPSATSTAPTSPLPTVINVTVNSHSSSNLQMDSEEWRRQAEETRRLRVEEERREDTDKLRRMIEELSFNRDEMRRQLEEEHRLKVEQDNIRKKQEEQRLAELARQAAEQEAKMKRKAERERVRHEQEARAARLKCTFLKNVQLVQHRNSEVYDESVLNGKLIGLYFSAQWCPPSLAFTPVLTEFYEQVDDDLEVVFISSDRNEAEMDWYMQTHHGDWLCFPFGSQVGTLLSNQLSVNSIPTLVIMTPNGIVISMNGVQEVQACTNPQRLVNTWKASL